MGAASSLLLDMLEEEEEQEQQETTAREVRRHRRRTFRTRYYPRHREYHARVSYRDLSEDQCVRRLRLSKDAISDLCQLLQPDLQPRSNIQTALSVEVKVTTALNFYATGSFQAPAGHITRISQYAVHRCITEVTDALFRHAPAYVRFDSTMEQQLERQTQFFQRCGIPRVQGCIDCTHIAIRAPYHNALSFVNRKGYCSLNVQMVCDHRQKIMQVTAHFPGSVPDAHILMESRVPQLFETENGLHGRLLGDVSYPLKTWLLTPLRNSHTPQERAYNEAHSRGRNIIWHTFGLLKQRFRCLDRSSGALQYEPERVGRIIVVCCMLHNIAVERGVRLLGEDEWQQPDRPQEEDEDEIDPPADDHPLPEASQMRRDLIKEFFH